MCSHKTNRIDNCVQVPYTNEPFFISDSTIYSRHVFLLDDLLFTYVFQRWQKLPIYYKKHRVTRDPDMEGFFKTAVAEI